MSLKLTGHDEVRILMHDGDESAACLGCAHVCSSTGDVQAGQINV